MFLNVSDIEGPRSQAKNNQDCEGSNPAPRGRLVSQSLRPSALKEPWDCSRAESRDEAWVTMTTASSKIPLPPRWKGIRKCREKETNVSHNIWVLKIQAPRKLEGYPSS